MTNEPTGGETGTTPSPDSMGPDTASSPGGQDSRSQPAVQGSHFDNGFPNAHSIGSDPSQPAVSWTCPRCGLLNAPECKCDCGFSLGTVEAEQIKEHLAPSPPRPWIRYWARFVDSFLAGLTFSFLGAVFGVPVSKWNTYLVGLAGIYLWTPFEAAFLSSSRTTPGKYLFNIRISDESGDRLQYGTCLRRALLVLVKGLGLGIPIVPLFTQIIAYVRLQGQGITSWDSDCGAIVQHGDIGGGRVLAIVATFVLMLFLIGLGSSMK